MTTLSRRLLAARGTTLRRLNRLGGCDTRAQHLCCQGVHSTNLLPRFSTHSIPLTITNHIRFLATKAEEEVEEEQEIPIEEKYSRKTPLEHILLRPGMYVGANERVDPVGVWVVKNPPLPGDGGSDAWTVDLEHSEVSVVPALLKIFDEILVNATDHHLRNQRSCTKLDVTIHPGSSSQPARIFVTNNGPPIPLEIHAKEGMYLPELLFGHLLTGSNFEDKNKRLTGGRHGYGAKLSNIFSTVFEVEITDAKRKLRYKQRWSNNMRERSDPEIVKDATISESSTTISFVPDMKHLTGDSNAPSCLTQDDFSVLCRRVVDAAGCAAGKLKVTLNGKYLTNVASFAEYASLIHLRQADKSVSSPGEGRHSLDPGPILCVKTLSPRWTLAAGLSATGSFESVSFVNGTATTRGGTHVNVITQQITQAVQEHIQDDFPDLSISQGLVRRHMFVAINCLIENPTFDSQMKECLTTSPSQFGSPYALPKSFLKEIMQPISKGGPGIVERCIAVAQGRQQATFQQVTKKSKRQLLSIPKLEDAHKAGTNQSWDCTLILTEGDSAKALAVAGLEVVGRDRFGVFPLRGKFLNVRDASMTQLSNNEEVKALCSILGLEFDKEYSTVAERRQLRYGHVMLMTDQDNDGHHIKGLVINFFRYFWPKLLQPPTDENPDEASENPPFLSSFLTPLLKATRKGKKNEVLSFYTMSEYLRWRNELDENDLRHWNVKYYKGLGTSTPAEAKAYFSAFENHSRPFHWTSDADGERIDMVFDKNRAADRRDWILDEYDPDVSVEPGSGHEHFVSYEDFVNKEMIHFSHADNIRSIPSVVDGLKPSQRKVLYACFKRKLKEEVKVAQLTGYCAEHTAYHHGEASLQSTIIGMAQDFVGSNNINLLVPSGQFGTRLVGGADAASPRYIFTYLSPAARLLFPEIDDMLLNYLEDDGQKIEPEYFCPIIPLLLVNGATGIGTGWSTSIPPHDPLQVIDYIRCKLEEPDDLPSITPFARGFTGEIEATTTGFLTKGRATVVNDKTVHIDELPLRCWTSSYKSTLLKMRDRGEINEFLENHTTSKVSFKIQMKAAPLQRMVRAGLEKAFKLESSLPTTNMHAFDTSGHIQKYESAKDIANAFFPVRLALYHDRKSVLESEAKYNAAVFQNKARFIDTVINGKLDIVSGKRSKQETVAALHQMDFATSTDLELIRDDNALSKRRSAVSPPSVEDDAPSDSHFDYLLNMPLSSLTRDKVTDLQAQTLKKEEELSTIQGNVATDMWKVDLDKLERHLRTSN